MALDQNYYNLWFQSFRLQNTSGHRDSVQLKFDRNQRVPREVEMECDSRSVDPYTLLTRCSRSFFNDYPVGTKFLLKAKLNDREGGGLFFSSNYRWEPIEVVKST